MKLTAFLMLICTSCASKADTVYLGSSDTYMGGEAYYDYEGYAIYSCERGVPIYYVRDSSLRGSKPQRSTQAHEDAHLTTMRTLGCEEYHKLRSTPEGKLKVELIAFCAQAAQEARDDLSTYAEALDAAAKQLADYYGFGLTQPEVRERLQEMCP